MPLRLALSPGEKIFINGAVISGGEQPLVFYLFNRAQLLRGREIIKEDDADTIEKKLYFIIQLTYMFPEDIILNRNRFDVIYSETLTAWPEHSDALHEIHELVNREDYFKALKSCGRLFNIKGARAKKG